LLEVTFDGVRINPGRRHGLAKVVDVKFTHDKPEKLHGNSDGITL
jgi:hypothetical protein